MMTASQLCLVAFLPRADFVIAWLVVTDGNNKSMMLQSCVAILRKAVQVQEPDCSWRKGNDKLLKSDEDSMTGMFIGIRNC